jgi:hypothetical protein
MDNKKPEIKISEIKKAFELLKELSSKGLREITFVDDDGNEINRDKSQMDKYYDSNLNRLELIATDFYKLDIDVYDITNPREVNNSGEYDLLKNGLCIKKGGYTELQSWVKQNAHPHDLYLETKVSDFLAITVGELNI